MGETAAGLLSLPAENLRILLAGSVKFRELVGEANPTLAKAHIHIGPRDATGYTRPRALIDITRHREPSVAGGAGISYRSTGELWLHIARDIPSGYQAAAQNENAMLEFTNLIGAIVADMQALSGTATYLVVEEFEISDIRRTPEDDESRSTFYYEAEIAVRWGRP